MAYKIIMRKSVILFLAIILISVMGHLLQWYDFNTLLIVIISIVIGGYFGSKFMNKKSP